MSKRKEKVILSLGGSLIVPDAIDSKFVQDFRKCILNSLSTYQYVIFAGGGKTARRYQQAAKDINRELSSDAQDWIGIQASWLNAELLKQIFHPYTQSQIITDPRVKLHWNKSIWIGAGWKPGRSTDYDAVRVAVENGITTVINLSDIDYVYTKDPRKFKDAQPITEIAWKEFRKITGNTWNPGLNVPFDPIAARLAQQSNITVKILQGRNLKNVLQAIHGKSFTGTTIY